MTIAVARATFTVVETGETVTVLFNPETIRDSAPPNYAEQGSPGSASPVLQYTSGGVRTVSFTLMLDGDRAKNRMTARNELRTDREAGSADIDDEIKFYESLQYPVRSRGQLFTDNQPPLVLFSYGSRYQGFPCAVKVETEITMMRPNGDPMRATLQVTLLHRPQRAPQRSDIYRGA